MGQVFVIIVVGWDVGGGTEEGGGWEWRKEVMLSECMCWGGVK